MNKAILLTVPVFILAGILLLIPNKSSQGFVKGVKTINGEQIQVIEILAKGGYNPKEITVKAGIKTIVKVKTQNTFDCSAALSIPKLGIREILDSNNTKTIEIEPQKSGEEIEGTCQMGMYGFKIKFE